jgi:hypothetical protein
MDDRYTFARDGRLYHADRQTVEVLKAVQAWDEGAPRNAAQDLFERGLRNGRIVEGPARAEGHDQHVAPSADRPDSPGRDRHMERGRQQGHGHEMA